TGVDERPLRDILDYWFYASSSVISLEVIKATGKKMTIRLEKGEDEDPGIVFEESLFDGMRACKNDCIFCFVDQLPPGLRKTLYLKDDDYRLSFLHGNFITLNSLSPRDYRRIVEQRLSPLYVSIHCTSAEIRQYLMGTKAARYIMERLQRLTSQGIVIHGQIVVCPGINDGEILERSIEDLVRLGPNLRTVGVVPVGTTRYTMGKGDRPAVRRPTEVEAKSVIDRLTAVGERLIRETGRRFVYPADEWYVIAGEKVPEASFYDGFEQLQNGVGMLALASENVRKAIKRARSPIKPGPGVREGGGRPESETGIVGSPCRRHVIVVTAPAAYPHVVDWVKRMRSAGAFGSSVSGFDDMRSEYFDGVWVSSVYLPEVLAEITVASVKNEMFGPQVDVAGLLTGKDVMNALRAVKRMRTASGGWIYPDGYGGGYRYEDPLAVGSEGTAFASGLASVRSSGKGEDVLSADVVALIPASCVMSMGNLSPVPRRRMGIGLPDCVTSVEKVFLDDISVSKIERDLALRIRVVDPLNGDMVEALRGVILGTSRGVKTNDDRGRKYSFENSSLGYNRET
ncbi:MAG TPA: DUF512 domain-containing protein, partial [Clostridia bacterium]|nr:DUF512 domain-containing protein [Clostridia bacterium]